MTLRSSHSMCVKCKEILRGGVVEEAEFDEDETPENVGVSCFGPAVMVTVGGSSRVRPKRILCATCYRKKEDDEDPLEDEDEVSLKGRAEAAVDEFLAKPTAKRALDKVTGKALKDVFDLIEDNEIAEADDLVDDILKRDRRSPPGLVITSETEEDDVDEDVRW